MKFKLSEIMDLIGGGTPKTSKPEYWDGDIPWLSVKDFNNDFRYVYETEKHITQLGLENSSTKLLQPGDIIISARGTVGEIATIPFPMAFNQSCYGLRAKKEIVTEDFLYYLIKHNVYVLKRNTHGSVFDTITRGTFEGIEVDIPDLEIQSQIAGVLSDLDKKIELNSRINENLEQQATAIFSELTKDVTFKKPLSDFIKIKHGYAFKGDYISPEDNGIVLVTPGNFCIGGGFKESKCKYFTGEYPQDYVLQPDSLIVTMTDLSKEADTLGFGALVPRSSERVYLHNQRIGLVEPLSDELPVSFIYWYMRSYEYHMKIVGSASGSTVKHTSPGRILEQLIPIPEKEDLLKYGTVLDEIDNIVSRNNAENIYLHSLREALLPKLMSGEIATDGEVF